MYSFVGGCRDQPAAAAHFWPSQLLSPDFLAGTAQTVGNRIAKEKPVHAALCGNLHQAFVPLGERVLGVMPSSSNFGVGVAAALSWRPEPARPGARGKTGSTLNRRRSRRRRPNRWTKRLPGHTVLSC